MTTNAVPERAPQSPRSPEVVIPPGPERRVAVPGSALALDDWSVDMLQALRRLMLAVDQLRESLSGQLRINMTGYRALAELAGGELTPKELSLRLRLTTGSVTPLVNHLVQSGYVTREPHPVDRRSVMLWLTPAGRHAYGWIMDTYRQAVQDALADDAEGTVIAVGLLRRIAEGVEGVAAAQPD